MSHDHLVLPELPLAHHWQLRSHDRAALAVITDDDLAWAAYVPVVTGRTAAEAQQVAVDRAWCLMLDETPVPA